MNLFTGTRLKNGDRGRLRKLAALVLAFMRPQTGVTL